MENGMQMTFEECMPETFQKQTVGALDSHVRTYPLQENKSDFKETVQACFSELCTLSDSSKKKINPLTFSLRTLRICLVLMEDGISPDCSLKWIGRGMMQNGKCSTPKILESHKTEKGASLSDILEGEVPQKIFPIEGTDGENSVQIIAHKDGYRRNTQVFSPDGITETLDTGQGGGRGHHVALPCFIDLSYQESKSTDIARCLKARYDNGVSNLRTDKSSVAVKIMNKDYRHQHEAIHDTSGCGSTLMARDYKDAQRVAIPVLTPDRIEKRQNGRRFKENGEPMFTLTSQDRHGVAIDPLGVLRNVRTEYGKEVADTLDTSCNQGIFVQVSEELTVYAVWYEKYQCYIAIRKLTPKECFRLQGWSDDYFEKAQFVNSDSQLYKQAGNGVTVTVIEAIARKMKVESVKLRQ